MPKALIFTADMHIRDSIPKCRTDDFLAAQWDKFDQVVEHVLKEKAQWVDAGDFFHKATPSLSLVGDILYKMTHTQVLTVAGNHDMPAHNINRIDESGLGVLCAAGKAEILTNLPTQIIIDDTTVHLYGRSYGNEIPKPIQSKGPTKNILVYHGMVYANKNDIIPEAPGYTAKKLINMCRNYSLIVCGHNHQQFHVENDGTLLVNVGCLTRQAADYATHSPRILVMGKEEFKSGKPRFISIAHKKNVVTREHIEQTKQKEAELTAFVEQLSNIDDISLSFEENVEKALRKADCNKLTEQKVWDAING